MGDKETEEMTVASLKTKLLDIVAKQGFSILLLFLAVLYFWFSSTEKDHQIQKEINDQKKQTQSQIESLEIAIKDCNDYTRQTQENIIKENTEVMRQVLYELKNLDR